MYKPSRTNHNMGSLVFKGSTVRALAHSCFDDVDESIRTDGQLQ